MSKRPLGKPEKKPVINKQRRKQESEFAPKLSREQQHKREVKIVRAKIQKRIVPPRGW